jgi:uncharacterized repeat protein (TIGR01451 family)
MSGMRRKGKGFSGTKRVLVVLAMAIGALPLLPGVAQAHHAEIGASIDCDSVVSFTANAWSGQGQPGSQGWIDSRTNDSVAVWYTVDGGSPVAVTSGAFNQANGYSFSGTFQAPATGTIRVYAQAQVNWKNGAGPGGAQGTPPLSRPTNCGPPDSTDVSICHATGSSSNPYVLIAQLSAAGVFNGHLGAGHQGGEDIIPPFSYQAQTYSQNWDAPHQAIYNAGCVVSPDVKVTKSASASTALPGDQITFTVVVENLGGADATGVVVTDNVPAALDVTAVSGPGCSFAGQLVTCNVGTLGAGASATITITTTAGPGTGPCPWSPTNRAQVRADNEPPANNGNNQSNPVTVRVNCAPSVQITKSGPATVGQGGTVSYSIQVENTGTGPAQNVVVADSIPAGLTITNVSGPNCTTNGQNVSCNVGTLAAGASATVTITATAPTGSCPEIDNVASVQQGTQPAQQSNVVTTQVTGCAPDVDITKSASAQSVNPGSSFSYTVEVTNGGTAPASGVVVTDSVPAGLTITNVSGPGCSFAGQNVTCNVGTLAAGGSASITITVQATAQACPSVVNSAHVEWSGGSPNGSPAPAAADSNQVTVAVNCAPGISITKSASSTTISPGGSFTYTVQVANGGNASASGVVVTDSVPAGLTITNVSGPGCSFAGQNVTCNVGTLAAGGSASITITVQATAQACPSVVNSAHVAYQGGQGTSSATSNAVTVGVSCTPNVQIVKNSDAPAGGVDSGDSFSYTITVTNGGNAPATGVVVTDQIPAGLRVDGVTGPNCSVAGHLVTCDVGTLAAGSSATITIHVTANDAACPDVENSARVTWSQGGQTTARDSNTVDVDVDCVAGETITPTPEPSEEPTTVTPPGGVAFTGPRSDAIRLGFLAIALLVLGTGLMFAGYRRRARGDA